MELMILLRGVQGCGKTTFAKVLHEALPDARIFAADDYFDQPDGSYLFDASKLHYAHRACQENTERAMANGCPVIVHNTFATEKELKPYYEMAAKYNYTVTCLIVENRHGNVDVHSVPQEVREAISLKIRASTKLL